MDDGGGEVDDGAEAEVCLVGAHGDTLEVLEITEEMLGEVAPLVEFAIERQRLCAPRVLRDDDLGAACIEIGDGPVAVEGLVGDKAAELDAVQEWPDTHRVEAMARRLPSASVSARILVVMPASP